MGFNAGDGIPLGMVLILLPRPFKLIQSTKNDKISMKIS